MSVAGINKDVWKRRGNQRLRLAFFFEAVALVRAVLEQYECGSGCRAARLRREQTLLGQRAILPG